MIQSESWEISMDNMNLQCPECLTVMEIPINPEIGQYSQIGAFNTMQKSATPWRCPYCTAEGERPVLNVVLTAQGWRPG